MFCYKCGKKNKLSATFCEECGTKLFPKEEKEEKKEEKTEKATKKSSSATKEAVKEVGKETVKAAAVVATEGAKTIKKGYSAGKKIAIFGGLIAIILAGLNYYFTYMVESPGEVVQKAIHSIEKNDYKSFIECTDPSFQKKFEIGLGIAGGIINGATGIGIDWGQLLDIQSAFSDELSGLSGLPQSECNASNFKVIEIKGEKLSAFVDTFGDKIPSIGNALGSEAIVEFEVDNSDKCSMRKQDTNAPRVKYQLKVRKYGNAWLIPVAENENSLGQSTK